MGAGSYHKKKNGKGAMGGMFGDMMKMKGKGKKKKGKFGKMSKRGSKAYK